MFHLLVLESTPTICTRIHKQSKFQITELLLLHVCHIHVISYVSSELFDLSLIKSQLIKSAINDTTDDFLYLNPLKPTGYVMHQLV